MSEEDKEKEGQKTEPTPPPSEGECITFDEEISENEMAKIDKENEGKNKK